MKFLVLLSLIGAAVSFPQHLVPATIGGGLTGYGGLPVAGGVPFTGGVPVAYTTTGGVIPYSGLHTVGTGYPYIGGVVPTKVIVPTTQGVTHITTENRGRMIGLETGKNTNMGQEMTLVRNRRDTTTVGTGGVIQYTTGGPVGFRYATGLGGPIGVSGIQHIPIGGGVVPVGTGHIPTTFGGVPFGAGLYHTPYVV